MPNTREREKLIELLAEHCSFKEKKCVGCDKEGKYYEPMCKTNLFGKIADHLIANGVSVASKMSPTEPMTNCQQWIPVAERLPEDTSKVLAVVKSVCGKGNPYIQQVWYGTNGFHISDPDFGYLNMNRYVTHWMPLPPPPKGE